MTAEEIKRTIDLAAFIRARGIELKKKGRDLVGKCPFHNDTEPSLVVTPHKQLWHCMGCDKGGSVIDFVMHADGIDLAEAMKRLSGGTPREIRKGAESAPPEPAATLTPERQQQLLERVVTLYEKTFAETAEARAYLEGRGITDAGMLSEARTGFGDGTLPGKLPGDGKLRGELTELGVLLDSGRERFEGCIVFPVFDAEGRIATLYGRHTGKGPKRHVFLPDRPTGLWNIHNARQFTSLYLVESVIDALSLQLCGLRNVVSIQGTNGLGRADIAELEACGVRNLVLLLDGDEAGQAAAVRLKEKLSSFSCDVRTLPDDHDPNSFILAHGAQALAEFLAENWKPSPPESPAKRPTALPSGDGFAVSCGLRRYEIRGLEKGARKLKATVRVEHGGRLHVDTLDFYSARARRMLCQDLARVFDRGAPEIEADVTRLVTACEQWEPPEEREPHDAPPPIGPEEEAEARAFGRAPDLVERIVADFETCGLVGEKHNKLLCYLAAVSRRMDEPLSVLVLSSSGAGKSALQDTALGFCPPEDVIKLTSLTGKALFYKEEMSLKHKVLALEEGAGAEEASYAIRNLISAGELVIEATVKDTVTGRLTTMANRVQGPTAVFYTVTDPQVDPETRSRFFVLGVDESREQTRAILEYQRSRQRLGGLENDAAAVAALRRHRNFQRLLKPVAVVNPFADRLSYGDHRLQARRDQPKYLNLIRAVAFLRQMAKDVWTWKDADGESVPYVQVDLEDIRIANELAVAVLGTTLDELSVPSRNLLIQLEQMVADELGNHDADAADRAAISFTRRQIREASGWSNYRVHTHLKELVELEYVLIDSGRNGSTYRYRLAYDGQGKDGERFLLGLTDVAELAGGEPENRGLLAPGTPGKGTRPSALPSGGCVRPGTMRPDVHNRAADADACSEGSPSAKPTAAAARTGSAVEAGRSDRVASPSNEGSGESPTPRRGCGGRAPAARS